MIVVMVVKDVSGVRRVGEGFGFLRRIGEDIIARCAKFVFASIILIGPTDFGGFQIMRDVFSISPMTGSGGADPEQDYACFFTGYEKNKEEK